MHRPSTRWYTRQNQVEEPPFGTGVPQSARVPPPPFPTTPPTPRPTSPHASESADYRGQGDVRLCQTADTATKQTMMREATNMEEEMGLAEDFLRTMIDFLENGTIETVVEGEVVNYFRMCKQIEIYYEKFKHKGYYMSMDVETGMFGLSRSDLNKSKYDLSKIADKLFVKFCKPSTPSSLIGKAINVFIKDFGPQRVGLCVKEISGLKHIFCVETTIKRANEHKFNFEATLLMEGYESISTKPNGMCRVRDLLRELIIEDECAETVVAMFAVEDDLDPRVCRQIKKILLEHLRVKFHKMPHARIWLKMVSSITVIESINADESFLEFILDLLKHLSESITCLDSENKKFHSPPGGLSYEDLVHVITKFYRNKKSCQKIINFIFNQCGANPAVWYSVLDSCHTVGNTDVPALQHYDYSTPNLPCMRSIDWEHK